MGATCALMVIAPITPFHEGAYSVGSCVMLLLLQGSQYDLQGSQYPVRCAQQTCVWSNVVRVSCCEIRNSHFHWLTPTGYWTVRDNSYSSVNWWGLSVHGGAFRRLPSSRRCLKKNNFKVSACIVGSDVGHRGPDTAGPDISEPTHGCE